MAQRRRAFEMVCGALTLASTATACSHDTDLPSASTSLTTPGSAASGSASVGSSAGSSKSVKLAPADEKLLQDALGAPATIQVSTTGTVRPGATTGFDDASAKPGRYSVNVTCGMGSGKLQVSITPDASNDTTITHVVDCPGDRAVMASSVYTGLFATSRGVHVKNMGTAPVAYGIAIVTQGALASMAASPAGQ